ncbi:serine/threonine-protein kinase UCN-like [Zingiber officinale]|uniref:serine/threonine-protein kinase UCN-like n=1 Tax=Zingiber officinale TaxID=94328 RepID=UPI001C4B0CF1|nr:serine/threonine-protein kinase UCN-like [Zingiber officinale]
MDEEVVLDLNQIRAVRVLGRGAMASVFLVSAAPGSRLPTLFALKVFDKQSAAKPHALRRARWELSLLSRLSAAPGDHHHPFLPSLLGSVETPDLLAWAIPFCPGGDLHALRRSLSPSNEEAFSADAIRFYLSEIVTALAHLHSMRVAYHDLKPENVLLRSSGHIMLADFDLSRHLPARSTTHSSLPPPLPSDNHSHAPRRKLTRVFSFGAADDQIKKGRSARVSPASRRRTSSSSISKSREGSGGDDERSFSFVGTEEYVAPEVVRGEGHGFAVDWWALGILAYEMAYGQTPFRGRNRKETLRNILTLLPMFPGRRRTDLTDIIERLVVKDPERRLGFSGGAEEVKAHPFFDGVKWELLPEVARPPFLAPVILPFFLPFLLLSNLLCEEGTKIEGFRGVEEHVSDAVSPSCGSEFRIWGDGSGRVNCLTSEQNADCNAWCSRKCSGGKLPLIPEGETKGLAEPSDQMLVMPGHRVLLLGTKRNDDALSKERKQNSANVARARGQRKGGRYSPFDGGRGSAAGEKDRLGASPSDVGCG